MEGVNWRRPVIPPSHDLKEALYYPYAVTLHIRICTGAVSKGRPYTCSPQNAARVPRCFLAI